MNALTRNLTTEQQSVRSRMGCDHDSEEPSFTVTCPGCNGEPALGDGTLCDVCIEIPGQKLIHRCPRSFYSADISAALTAMSWSKKGVMPVAGGLADQSPSFIQFCQTFEGEIAVVRGEQDEERRIKALRK